MTKWKLTEEDVVTVLQRKGYKLIDYSTKVGYGRGGRPKYQDVLYAFLPGVVYGFNQWCPENTAEAVFSRLVEKRGFPGKEDYLDSI